MTKDLKHIILHQWGSFMKLRCREWCFLLWLQNLSLILLYTLSLFCSNHNGTHPATSWCCFSKHRPIRSPNEKMDQSKAWVFSHFYHKGSVSGCQKISSKLVCIKSRYCCGRSRPCLLLLVMIIYCFVLLSPGEQEGNKIPEY